jgi:pimeloyl-ACP methyl ester carboxylesterase
LFLVPDAVSGQRIKHVNANGADFAYVEKGRGVPILLVHGSLSDFNMWSAQMNALARNHRVIALSRRYHWPNVLKEEPRDYTPQLHANDVAAFIRALELEPVHLVGHSYGGFICAYVAKDHPELVRSLTLIEPPIFSFLPPRPEPPPFVTAALNLFARAEDDSAVKSFITGVHGPGSFERLSPEIQKHMLLNAHEMRAELRMPSDRYLPAFTWVVRRDLIYDDLSKFLADATRLSTEDKVEHVGALILGAEQPQARTFKITIGKFCASAEEADFRSLTADLSFKSNEDLAQVSYFDYLHREAARNASAVTARKKTPSRLLYVTMFVPGSVGEEFVARILATPAETARVTRFSLYTLPVRRFARPMFMLPRNEELALCIFLLRGVPIADGDRTYAEAVNTVRGLVEKTCAVGGKIYPPYAPFFSRADWEAHYGPNWLARAHATSGRISGYCRPRRPGRSTHAPPARDPQAVWRSA